MDKTKNNLIKSKSNAVTATQLNTRKNKISRSNAEIKPLAMKRRGVYVEKKPTKISLNNSPYIIPNRLKCSPSPSKKLFVTSVLAELAKNTTATQYSVPGNPSLTKQPIKNKTQAKRKEHTVEEAARKRPKYKSRVLNHQEKDIVVLKSKKDISPTPSNCSLRSSRMSEMIKWSCAPRQIPKTSKDVNKSSDVFRITDKPTEKDNRDDKKLYNFFVELLETTFDMYNVKSAFTAAPLITTNSSKINLEMDAKVARKLKISNTNNTSGDSRRCKKKKPNFLKPRKRHDKEIPNDDSRSVTPINMIVPKRKLKPKPIPSNKKSAKSITQSVIHQKPPPPNKKLVKKDLRKNLLQLLKNQLRADNGRYSEPPNFFQALRVMAKNKMRNQNPLYLNEAKRPNDEDLQCRFKRHRLLSRNTKSNRKISTPSNTTKSTRSFPKSSRNGSLR